MSTWPRAVKRRVVNEPNFETQTRPEPDFNFESQLRPESLIFRVSQDMHNCGISKKRSVRVQMQAHGLSHPK